MNKTELIDKIAAGSGLSKADSKKALDNVKEYEKFEIEKWCMENRDGFV